LAKIFGQNFPLNFFSAKIFRYNFEPKLSSKNFRRKFPLKLLVPKYSANFRTFLSSKIEKLFRLTVNSITLAIFASLNYTSGVARILRGKPLEGINLKITAKSFAKLPWLCFSIITKFLIPNLTEIFCKI
jgi:hypothetical protein